MEKSCRKCAPKASPRPLFYFGKQPKTAIACKKFFWKQGILKGGYQKPLKKLTWFFFRTQSLLIEKVIKNKRGLELVTSRSSDYEKKLFILFTLSDEVWWCNIKRFWSYSKNYTCKVMQASSWHHKLFYFHLFFCIWKAWKERGKITKIWISRERKELFRWNKKHFSQFLKENHLAKK